MPCTMAFLSLLLISLLGLSDACFCLYVDSEWFKLLAHLYSLFLLVLQLNVCGLSSCAMVRCVCQLECTYLAIAWQATVYFVFQQCLEGTS